MRIRLAFLVMAVTLAAVLLIQRRAPAEPHPDNTPQYKSPLDVTVDEKGQTARVVLPYLRKLAVVDLVKGSVKEELPLKDWKPVDVPMHVVNSDPAGPDTCSDA